MRHLHLDLKELSIMFFNTAILAALASLAPVCYGSTIPGDPSLGDIVDKGRDIAAHWPKKLGSGDVFEAFLARGHPDAAPKQNWTDENGEVYQSFYTFDTAEWNNMTDSLMLALGIDVNDTDSDLGLSKRQDGLEPDYFYCQDHGSWAWTISAGGFAAGVCDAFGYGVTLAGTTQVVRRRAQNIMGDDVIFVFSYLWAGTRWLGESTCAIAITYGLDGSCSVSASPYRFRV